MTLHSRLTAWFRYRLLGYSSSAQEDLHDTLLEGYNDSALEYDLAEVKLGHHSFRHISHQMPGYLNLVVHCMCSSQPEYYRTYPPTGRWYQDLFQAIYQNPVYIPDKVTVEKVLRQTPRETVDHLYNYVRQEHCFSLIDASQALGPEYVARARQKCLTREEVMWMTYRPIRHPIPSRPHTKVREHQHD